MAIPKWPMPVGNIWPFSKCAMLVGNMAIPKWDMPVGNIAIPKWDMPVGNIWPFPNGICQWGI